MGAFGDFAGKNIEDVKPDSRNPFLGLGVFDLQVIRCVGGQAKNGGAFYYVAEFEVLSSNNVEFPVGSNVSYYIGFKYEDSAKKKLLNFLMDGMGLDLAEAQKAIKSDATINTQQILAGEKCRVVVRESLSPVSKKMKKNYNWTQIS